MRHSHPPRRVAAFVAESVNVQQLQAATDALNRSNRRAVLVSDQHALLRGYNGSAEINFAVAETSDELDTAPYDAFILLEGADKLAESATRLARAFSEAGKPVIALTGAAGLLADIAGTGDTSPEAASAYIDGQLYQSTDSDADWQIINAVTDKLETEMSAA